MLRFGGRYYWGRKEGGKVEGIAVLFAWMSSQQRHLQTYVHLYSSLGWNSLICHSQFLNMFFPEKATPLASHILTELIKELKIRPCPVVFVAFSGGPKACMYNVLQMIEVKFGENHRVDDHQLLRSCISGFIYDSSPIDFTSDLGVRFVLHPTALKMSHPPRFVSWVAKGIASGLDVVFLNRFEAQRSEYWQTLYSSASLGAPYLILCSENDKLAPYRTITNFVQRLQELEANVKLVKWDGSSHVGHYRTYPVEYKAAVIELLEAAVLVFLKRTQDLRDKVGWEGKQNGVSKLACNLRKVAAGSSQGFHNLSSEPFDQFLLSSSTDSEGGQGVASLQDGQKDALLHFPGQPSINAHGVLGQILFDVCIPKNVEGWDVWPEGSTIYPPFSSKQGPGQFNPIKCIWRSRL